MIVAKPTLYADTRFRSRLEARWAVFFDALGVKWTYEPLVEGITGYQPDFGFAEGFGYAEIKSEGWADSAPQERLRADINGKFVPFVRATQQRLLVHIGEPGRWTNGRLEPTTDVLHFTPRTIQDGLPPWERASWAECTECGALRVVPLDRRICTECPPVGYQIRGAMNAARDASYVDAL